MSLQPPPSPALDLYDGGFKRLPPDEVLRPLITGWAREGKRCTVVCFIDLDRFAEINRRLGMAGGNAALEEAHRRVRSQMPREGVLARLNGDEFAAVFAALGSPQCHQVLERMLAELAKPWKWGGHTVDLQGSLGARLLDADGPAPELALRQASHAAYLAKRAGDGRVHYFDAPQARVDEQLVKARRRIQEGLEGDEFFLCYQPKVDMQRGVMVGVEALIRWQHPERGLLQPGQFVPLTEGDELAERMGDWVIGAALRQAYEWRSAGLRTAISVNVSPQHMMRWDFVDRLAQQLARFPRLGAGTLELEILETTAISKFSVVAHFVEACKDLGVPVAIDDFGTGYSSLTYLRQLPVSSVKIDQSFIRGMLENEQDRAIVQGILALLKALDRTAVAEGVETLAHGEALLAMGCTLAQGYGIAMPLAAGEIPRWVKDFERVPLWGPHQHRTQAVPGPSPGR